MRTRIKLCGFQTEETVQAACQAGADALGFVLYPPSARSVSLDQVRQLLKFLGTWQTPVALFVNPDNALVRNVLEHIPNVLLQFHGEETPDFCESFQRPFIKAIRMRPGVDLLLESKKFQAAQALLVDTWSEIYGGTGHTFDWSLLPPSGQLKQALVLSGGLNESNVAQAIKNVNPYGVDVSSGVELTRGVKSIEKIKRFCAVVQKTDAELLQVNQ